MPWWCEQRQLYVHLVLCLWVTVTAIYVEHGRAIRKQNVTKTKRKSFMWSEFWGQRVWNSDIYATARVQYRDKRMSQREVHVYGSVHRWSILITVQRDATQSSLFIILPVHSTCFGCQPHPSSILHKTVTTASGTVQLPPSNVAKLGQAWPSWREVVAQKYDQYRRL